MSNLYGVHDELPADIGDAVLDDEKAVGPADDDETATLDDEDAR